MKKNDQKEFGGLHDKNDLAMIVTVLLFSGKT